MSRVLTFCRYYPATHPKKGIDTFFPEMILKSLGVTLSDINEKEEYAVAKTFVNDFSLALDDPKHHTIRAGERWKVGDIFCPRVWSNKPYASKQIQFAPDIEVKKVWRFETNGYRFFLNDDLFPAETLVLIAQNDGLSIEDFKSWFAKPFKGQIICWNDSIEY